ncbi:MAG: response regulator [Candidatus Hydrogenedentota bacterium]|nr:MAG: response regulator [Candidatus Hydrogenedentota bacterium]
MTEESRITILNVNDDESTLYTISRILRKERFEVIEATTGNEALRMAEKNPDLILLDIKLPDIQGFEVCQRIKADPKLSTVPVLLLSATFRDAESKVMGLNIGADGYLTQPVEPPVLVAYINALLRAHSAEKERAKIAQQWSSTFDCIANGICVLDTEGRILQFNKAVSTLLGKTINDIVGRFCWEIMHDASELPERCLAMTINETLQRQTEVYQNGDQWFRVDVDPILDDGNKIVGAIHIVTDITERKLVEESLRKSEARYRVLSENLDKEVKKKMAELQQAENLAAIGRVVSSVAHEVRNPLQNIRMGVDALQKEIGADTDKAEILEEINYGVDNLNTIIEEVLEYSKPVKLNYSSISIEEILKRALKRVSHRLAAIAVHTELVGEEDEVLVDASKLEGVLVNLISNAADAMAEGGDLWIRSDSETIDGTDYLRLSISDTGSGIDEDSLGRICEPFYTTKARGTGLGLSICRKIVDAHNGSLSIESKVDEGTSVEIRIPLQKS